MEIMKRLNKREKYKNDIEGLQYVAFDILKIFDEICRRNKIEYWLTDGTLLGAVRHKGYIPWDDDVDVCVKASDIERVKNILEKELPYYLYVTNDEFFDGKPLSFLKIRDRYSIEAESEIKKLGIWIDIFPMNEVKENKLINFIMKNIPTNIVIKEEKNIKKYIKIILWKVLKLFNLKTKRELAKKLCKKILVNDLEKSSYIYTNGEMWWHLYKKEWIFPLKEIEFEGHKFYCPNDYHNYLKSYYGNYMQLPPEDQRKGHAKFIRLCESDLENSISLKWNDREEDYKKWIKENEKYKIVAEGRDI